MREFSLPHIAPLRFAKYVISENEVNAVVKNRFESVPSLGMLIEAVAQSSAAFVKEDSQGNVGYLTTLKNIKLLQKPNSLEFDISVTKTQQLGNVGNFSFEVKQETELIAVGSFMVFLT